MKINNGFLGYIFDNVDFLVRFLYCKLPVINKILFWKLYTSDFKQLDYSFEKIKKLMNDQHQSFKDKTCLELGPGNSYNNAYNFLMNGAKKVILIDKFPRYIKTTKQKEYFKRELEYIEKKYNKKELFFVKGDSLNKRYIRLIAEDITQSDIKEKVDFIYSISVFEHIRDVEGNIKKLSKILKNDGLMYHSIDLRDHYNFNNPFLFYKYSKRTWEKYLAKEGISYTNRVRYNEYIKLFKKHGFKILKEEIERFPFNTKKLNKEFQNQDNLDIGTLRILLKRCGQISK